MRIFDRARVWQLESKVFESVGTRIAEDLLRSGALDAVVAIARGGRAFGRLVSRAAGAPYHEVLARSNASDRLWSEMIRETEVEPVADLGLSAGARIAVVDDICGTGRTLDAVCAALRACGYTNLCTATLCLNAGSMVQPDNWAWLVRDWVSFPWEELPAGTPTEMLSEPSALCPGDERARRRC